MNHRITALLVSAFAAVAVTAVVNAQTAESINATVRIEVTVWRSVSDPNLLYLSTRPEGGRWRTENRTLDMSRLSQSRSYHQSRAVLVAVPVEGGGTATVEVTLWRSVSRPALLYVSTRPQGGRWHTENSPLDMSGMSPSRTYHQSNRVIVEVPLERAASAVSIPALREVRLSDDPTFDVRVVGVRFFEGGRAHPPADERVYTSVFKRQTTRFINWQISLVYPPAPAPIAVEVEAIFSGPGGEVARQTSTFNINKGWTNSRHFRGRGWSEPPFLWPVGQYRVDLRLDGEVIASGEFQLVDDPVPEKTAFSGLRESLPWGSPPSTLARNASLHALAGLHSVDPILATSVVSLPWVQEEPSDLNRRTLQQFEALAREVVLVARDVADYPWFSDGITEDEWLTVRALFLLAEHDSPLALAVGEYEWLQDDVTPDEREALEELVTLATLGAGGIARMPFLTDLSTADRYAIAVLRRLARQDPDTFRHILQAPAIADGISDDEAKVVVTLRRVAQNSPEALTTLLDMTDVTLEEREVVLESGESVLVTLIRTETGAERTIEFAATGLASVANFMGYAPPGNHVIVFVGDSLTSQTATHFGDHIVIAPHLDRDSYSSYRLLRTLSHEFSHLYWSQFSHLYWPGIRVWIDEGIANALGAISVAASFGNDPHPYEPPCYLTSAIVDWLELKTIEGNAGASCDYSLGERLFLGIRRSVGDSPFRAGIRELRRIATAGPADHGCDEEELNVCHVEAAFRSAISTPEQELALAAVIARWYHGEGTDDLSHLDTTPSDPHLTTGTVTITGAYLSLAEERSGDTPVQSFSARDVSWSPRLILEWSLTRTADPKELHMVVEEAFEDGFSFTRRERTSSFRASSTGAWTRIPVGVPRLSEQWAAGQYFVYVYYEGRKVAEVTYEVTP